MQFSSIHLMLFVIEWSTMCHKSIVGLNTENKYMIPHFDIIGTMFNRTNKNIDITLLKYHFSTSGRCKGVL